MFCDGQLLPISENETLFNLIHHLWRRQSTFALPDLRSRLPIRQGCGFIMPRPAVRRGHVDSSQMPPTATALASSSTPPNAVRKTPYWRRRVRCSDHTRCVGHGGQALSNAGGSQPHTNLQPYLCMNFIIRCSALPVPT